MPRKISLNGYIDSESFWGDEITPASLHELLYGADGLSNDEVEMILNSYGGSCTAAVQMHDDINAYPGYVTITISGTAASAATVLAQAADKLQMTAGSMFMIHDPSTIAWGNERDMQDAINLLAAAKASILNVYETRCKKPRDEIARMMSETTWMDARTALENGFIDGIAGAADNGVKNAVQPPVNRDEAEKRVRAYLERNRPQKQSPAQNHTDPAPAPAPEPTPPAPEPEPAPATGPHNAHLRRRLELLKTQN